MVVTSPVQHIVPQSEHISPHPSKNVKQGFVQYKWGFVPQTEAADDILVRGQSVQSFILVKTLNGIPQDILISLSEVQVDDLHFVQ